MPLLCGNPRLGPRSSDLQQLDRGRHADLLLLRQLGPPVAKRVCVFNFLFHMVNVTSMKYSAKGMMEPLNPYFAGRSQVRFR